VRPVEGEGFPLLTAKLSHGSRGHFGSTFPVDFGPPEAVGRASPSHVLHQLA
jgi:hypothetical protein